MTATETLDCGHTPVQNGMATGVAHTPDGRAICLACSDVEEIDRMKTARDIFAHISDDHRTVTTWTGAKLGNVTWRTVSEGRWSTFGIVHRHYVRVTDIHGGHWYGSGPVENGTYVRLHRTKGN